MCDVFIFILFSYICTNVFNLLVFPFTLHTEEETERHNAVSVRIANGQN